MSKRLLKYAMWVSLLGCVMTLSGLGIDAYLHGQDPGLAAHEGIFTLSNPGHLMLVVGIGLIVVGSVAFLVGKALQRRPDTDLSPARLFYGAGAVAVVALALGAGILALNSEGSLFNEDHDHAAVAGSSPVPTVTSGASTGSTTPSAHNHGGTSTTPGTTITPTTDQQTAAGKLVSDTKSGIARLEDYDTAVAEGYKQITPYVLGQGAAKYGPAHFYNAAYDKDGQLLDPSKPEALVYFKMPGGKMVLLGAMFLAPIGQGPTPGGPLTTWHTHDNLCAGAGGITLKNQQGDCPAGAKAVTEKEEMMHVWIFDNPDGPFAHNLTVADYRAALKQLAAV
ncbi:MAG: hypothetical protein J0I20_17120 [Chloroflexi bacterium]|nr:hypothetical protein [Chloroflexota bacterium]OJV88163.1 MAG: hypothetical protein BGO39_08180 [Chloroflexi bacterium 54-19]